MKWLVYIIILINVFACNQGSGKKVDDFYTNKGGFDLARIPLVKPYEATTPSTKPNWIITSIDTNDIPAPVNGIEDIRVIKGIILAHGKNTTVNYKPAKDAWFIIVPTKRLVAGFRKHGDYVGSLKNLGFEKEPDLFKIIKVFKYFDCNDHINWELIK
ncbi:hypothetical protein [Mucilaginibacter jinjuensis]|uniref:Uncharacterized protein n=1 Tax=Mucilaginibacter jinjuensis TaxID=1176721 RepID=A0ABY7T6E6_9SPHI|nr:hypothetical protein [Mucilaginibacter jinjuensis]WCT12059.1 hypothetical protein PQO05_25335 [Mucilaginibacter jinjuensis]